MKIVLLLLPFFNVNYHCKENCNDPCIYEQVIVGQIPFPKGYDPCYGTLDNQGYFQSSCTSGNVCEGVLEGRKLTIKCMTDSQMCQRAVFKEIL